MKNFVQILVLCLLISSCDSNDPAIPDTNLNNEKIALPQEEDILLEAIIDDSDLSDLPEDIGGIQQAYPMGTTTAEFGHFAYTPSGYENDGPEYPLILFLHGWGSRGDSRNDETILNNVLSDGPPKLIRYGGWDPNYPFIVVSPQLSTDYWPTDKVHRFIEYIIENYQVNTKRIYLTGLSLGGGGCWYYVGELADNYAAAIVPISASGSEYLLDNLRKTPIWVFQGANDELVKAFENFGSVPMVETINETEPIIRAKVTVYPNIAHDGWTRTYDGRGMFTGFDWYDQYNMNIYDWMLQFKKE